MFYRLLQCLNCREGGGGGLGGLNPPSYFLDPPNGVADFILGVDTYSTRTIYIAVWKDSDSQKNSTPQLFFHNSNPDLLGVDVNIGLSKLRSCEIAVGCQ